MAQFEKTDAAPTILAVIKHFRERCEQQGYKRITRDKAAIEFFGGAAVALDAVKHSHAQAVLNFAVLVVAIRGWQGIREYENSQTRKADMAQLASDEASERILCEPPELG